MKMRASVLVLFAVVIVSLPALCAEYEEPYWVYKGQGDRYLKYGENGKAIVAYKKALSARMQDRSADTAGSTAYPEVNLQLAKIYLTEGLYEPALSQIETAQKNSEHLQIPDLIFEIKYTKASILSAQNKNPEPIYRDIIADDPHWIRYSREPFENTILGTRAIESGEAKGKYAKAHYELGRIKFENANYENAVRFFEMALLYRYKPEQAVQYLIDCYLRIGDAPMARKVRGLYESMK